mgnify:CR=1 FL=1
MVQIFAKKIKKNYLFSIITPTYNRPLKLKKQYLNLKKIKRKQLIEWILVVEKQDFETIKIIKTFKNIKKRMVFNTGGLNKAFTNGAKKASGKYLSFLGDDDKLSTNSLALLEKIIIKKNPDWIIGQSCYTNNNKKIRNNITRIKNFLLKYYSRNILMIVDFIMTPSSFAKKEIFEKSNYFDPTHWYGNDYVCWIKFSKICEPIVLNKIISYVHYDDDTKSGSYDYMRFIMLYYNISKETNNYVIKLFQFLSISYILFHNFVFKKLKKLFK